MWEEYEGIIALIVIAVVMLTFIWLGNRQAKNEPAKRRCPFCDEIVRHKAVKCKHCSSSIPHSILDMKFKENYEEVLELAEKILGNKEASEWLSLPCKPLGHEKPLDLLGTDEGADKVKGILYRIENGVFS